MEKMENEYLGDLARELFPPSQDTDTDTNNQMKDEWIEIPITKQLIETAPTQHLASDISENTNDVCGNIGNDISNKTTPHATPTSLNNDIQISPLNTQSSDDNIYYNRPYQTTLTNGQQVSDDSISWEIPSFSESFSQTVPNEIIVDMVGINNETTNLTTIKHPNYNDSYDDIPVSLFDGDIDGGNQMELEDYVTPNNQNEIDSKQISQNLMQKDINSQNLLENNSTINLISEDQSTQNQQSFIQQPHDTETLIEDKSSLLPNSTTELAFLSNEHCLKSPSQTEIQLPLQSQEDSSESVTHFENLDYIMDEINFQSYQIGIPVDTKVMLISLITKVKEFHTNTNDIYQLFGCCDQTGYVFFCLIHGKILLHPCSFLLTDMVVSCKQPPLLLLQHIPFYVNGTNDIPSEVHELLKNTVDVLSYIENNLEQIVNNMHK
ncbi:hypothetical protein QTN25_000011 [Entamoeba marina]